MCFPMIDHYAQFPAPLHCAGHLLCRSDTARRSVSHRKSEKRFSLPAEDEEEGEENGEHPVGSFLRKHAIPNKLL